MKQALFRIATSVLLMSAFSGCAPVVLVGGAAATGALVAEDRRTTGIQLEDKNIEIKASSRINEKHKDTVHINVTSFNRNVLITGEAPTTAVKADIEKIVAGIENVRGVINEIAVAGMSSLGTRANDAYITSKVKAAYLSESKFYPNHVKVVTESNIVYLMGIVLKKEADDATEITRGVGGVQKVVRVFEYGQIVQPAAPHPPAKTGG